MSYCTALLLPGERKSVEPMAARLAPHDVRRVHQSLHHLVADAPWNDEEMLAQVRREVLPAMQKHGPVVAWIIDDTGFPKQGKHSVGVARQYCGELGKSDNCQAAVSLSVSTWNSSLPVAWRLYLPEVWCEDAERCRRAGVPEEIGFQTKPEIALEQIRQAMEQGAPVGVVLADAGYGKGTQFRTELTQLGLQYAVGIESNATVWEPGQPLAAPARRPGRGAPPKRLQRNAEHLSSAIRSKAILPDRARCACSRDAQDARGLRRIESVKFLHSPGATRFLSRPRRASRGPTASPKWADVPHCAADAWGAHPDLVFVPAPPRGV